MSELVDVSVKAVAWLAGLALLACVLQVGAYVRAARRPSRPLARATRRPKFGVIMSVRGGDEALLDALRSLQAQATLELCRRFVTRFPETAGRPQAGADSFYPRRRVADSRLDPAKTVADQFDLLRVVDNERYPAFFEHRGRKYRLAITAA